MAHENPPKQRHRVFALCRVRRTILVLVRICAAASDPSTWITARLDSIRVPQMPHSIYIPHTTCQILAYAIWPPPLTETLSTLASTSSRRSQACAHPNSTLPLMIQYIPHARTHAPLAIHPPSDPDADCLKHQPQLRSSRYYNKRAQNVDADAFLPAAIADPWGVQPIKHKHASDCASGRQ